MGADGDASLDTRLETIERRMGRLERLINVVLEKQEHHMLKIERRIDVSFEKVGFSVERAREDIQDFLVEQLGPTEKLGH